MIPLFERANQYIRDIKPYQAGKPIEEVERELGISNIIKLASNENPLGASPKALYAIKKIMGNTHIYPDASYQRLRGALAKYNKVGEDNITVGNGSENCMEFLMKSFLNNDSDVIVDQYCFATIRIL
ncbi:MAG: aminotransferase class I/II-fold pyridoxal phosphate-dependent enzyme, partial [Burkholderiales bacterium]|nr:aminotransferase class I/II-fold pyridoxal phosphate-dependent enzyme [Burkholderiales bacterium]